MSWVLIVWVYASSESGPRVHHVPGLLSREACESTGAALKKAASDSWKYAALAYVCGPEARP